MLLQGIHCGTAGQAVCACSIAPDSAARLALQAAAALECPASSKDEQLAAHAAHILGACALKYDQLEVRGGLYVEGGIALLCSGRGVDPLSCLNPAVGMTVHSYAQRAPQQYVAARACSLTSPPLRLAAACLFRL